MALRVSLAAWDHDRVAAIHDGRAGVPGVEIDGLPAPGPPAAFVDGNPGIRRLVPDYERVERDYHKRTGFFPIMHLVAVRKSLVAEHPWLPRALLDAVTAARDVTPEELFDPSVLES